LNFCGRDPIEKKANRLILTQKSIAIEK